MEVVKHAMKRDEKDPSIMDLDHDKSLKSQQKEPVAEESSTTDDGPALKDDPEFAKVSRPPMKWLRVIKFIGVVANSWPFDLFGAVFQGEQAMPIERCCGIKAIVSYFAVFVLFNLRC